MMTWALVPLAPKEEIPARCGASVVSHGTGSVRSRTVPSDQSTWAALVIGAGCATPELGVGRLLSKPAMRSIGRLSY